MLSERPGSVDLGTTTDLSFYKRLQFQAYVSSDDCSPHCRSATCIEGRSIEFGGGVFDCTIRNVSDTGAALELMTPLYIPDRFTLINATDNSKRPCRVVWRKQKRIGVTFE